MSSETNVSDGLIGGLITGGVLTIGSALNSFILRQHELKDFIFITLILLVISIICIFALIQLKWLDGCAGTSAIAVILLFIIVLLLLRIIYK